MANTINSMTTSVDSLFNQNAAQIYSATASVGGDGASINGATSQVTGDRTTGLFNKKNTGMDKSSFLKLLMTQMQFQDPLNPADSTQYVAELAQFSALESSNNIETAVNKLNDSFSSTVTAQNASAQSLTNASAVSLIGKDVRLKQDSFTWGGVGSTPVTLRINLGNLNGAQVQIVDEEGNVVRTLTTGAKDSTTAGSVTWNGIMDNGKSGPAGTYAINVVGSETNGNLYAFVQDKATGVTFTNGQAMVKVDGKVMSVASIMDVSQDDTSVSDTLSMSPISAVGLIGKQVKVHADSIMALAQEGENHVIQVNMGNAATARVQITDQLGQVVATRIAQRGSDGTATIEWNGLDDGTGTFVPAGNYSLNILGQELDPGLYCYEQGRVDGVGTVNGALQIRVNGSAVSAADIYDIEDPKAAS